MRSADKSCKAPLLLGASAIMMAQAVMSSGFAQTNITRPTPDAPNPTLKTLPPKGFEDVDDSVSTEFDLHFQDRSVGSFRATFKDGHLSFIDPQAVARALGPNVDTAMAAAFLSKPLPANEQFKCRPGVMLNTGCGVLPGESSGLIVNPESFSVSLFLGRDYLISSISGPRMLGPAISGPSLIQTVRFSAIQDAGSGASFGGTFDTLASMGRTSLVAQTTLSDYEGLRSQQLYAQHIWSDRRAAVGLLQDYQSLVFTNYRVIGAELGSFYGTLLDSTNDTATPLEVLLPQRAQVEIYRDGVLMTAGRYDAGLQLLNTAALPEGSYTVRIVARDGARVLLDQSRTFSKISNMVPPGKTAFRVRVGERAADNFAGIDGSDSGGFLPKTTGELVVSASAQRRLGRAMAGSVMITSFESRVYGESSLQLFSSKVSGLVGGGLGSDGTYSALVSTNIQLQRVSFYLSARTTHVPNDVLPIALDDRYHAFFRSQDTLFGSAQTRLLGGSLGLTGSYSKSSDFPTRYAVGLQYSRSIDLPFAASALLMTGVTKSDFDTRFGFSISFFKRVDRKTTASFTGGASYVTDSQQGVGGRRGFSPVGEALLSRQDQLGSVDLVSEGGVGTDADGDRAFGRVRALSPYGSGDASVQWQNRPYGGNTLAYLMNGQTGFAIGGNSLKLGLRDPAEAMVMLDLTDAHAAPEDDRKSSGTAETQESGQVSSNRVASGGYRVTVDGRSYDYIAPGNRVALGLPAFKEYSIGLKPEGAPQFDVDSVRRKVTLYPGNVVNLRFEAQRVISLFGQILAEDGQPLLRARVEAGTDYAVADDRGYFTITAPLSSQITIRHPDGAACTQRAIGSLVNIKAPSLLYRFGKILCTSTRQGPSSDQSEAIGPVSQAPVHEASPAAPSRENPVEIRASHANPAVPPVEPPSPLALLIAKEFIRQMNA